MNNMNCNLKQNGSEGFSLIELLVTVVIAMIILGGLLFSFSSQNTEYKYQNKRIDAVQDLEFSIRFIADDLRRSLFSAAVQPIENYYPPLARPAQFKNTPATTRLTFWVWDSSATDSGCVVDSGTRRAQRQYEWSNANKSLRYDRMVDTNPTPTLPVKCKDNTGTAAGEILPNVTFFKVFKDNPPVLPAVTNLETAARVPFANIPAPMPALTVLDSRGNAIAVSGYTILIEIEVVAGYKNGVLRDVQGNTTTTKRIWRYVQVYPQAAAI